MCPEFDLTSSPPTLEPTGKTSHLTLGPGGDRLNQGWPVQLCGGRGSQSSTRTTVSLCNFPSINSADELPGASTFHPDARSLSGA